MVEVMVSPSYVRLELTGWDRLSLKTNLTFPTAGIRIVYADPNPLQSWQASPFSWVRIGISLPGVIQAGTFTGQGHREFWCFHFTGRSVVFELEDLPYSRIVVDVRDPEAVVQRVRAARYGVGTNV